MEAMARNELFDKVAETVAETMNVDAEDLTPETTFESLSADSIDLIELVTALEEDFDTAIDDDRLTSIKSIGDAVDLLSQNL